jgi:hypothetical protein
MMAWYYLALGLWVMVSEQRGRWCLLLMLPCWVESQWEIPVVGLRVGGEPGGPGGLGEIDRALQLWGCRGPWAPLLARGHCRVGLLVKGLPEGGRRLLVVGEFLARFGCLG